MIKPTALLTTLVLISTASLHAVDQPPLENSSLSRESEPSSDSIMELEARWVTVSNEKFFHQLEASGMIPPSPGAAVLVPPKKADALFSSIAKAKGVDWFSLRISTSSGRRARGEALRRIPLSREGNPARVSEQDFGFTLDVKPTVHPHSGGVLLDLEMVPRWVQFEGLMEGSAQPVTSRLKTEVRISMSSGDAAVLVLSEAKGGKQAELLLVRARIAPKKSLQKEVL